MIHRIEVVPRHEDPHGKALRDRINRFSSLGLESVRTCQVFSFDGEAALGGLEIPAAQLGVDLFADPVLHQCFTDGEMLAHVPFDWYVEVGFRPGVTDNVGRTAQESIEYRTGKQFAENHHAHMAMGYFLKGKLSREETIAMADEWLANELIQQIVVLSPDDWPGQKEKLFHLPRVILTDPVKVELFPAEDFDLLARLSKERVLALSENELRTIQGYFAQDKVVQNREQAGLGAEATDVELEMLAQTWSEHCKHKIFNAEIEFTDETGATRTIKSLYKTYIQGATKEIRAELGADDPCLSVFTDNAGVVKFDDENAVVVKVETHNSPSALDPYGGALTGIVGVNRDPFGTGRGAELLFNTDMFCFASPFHDAPLPPRLLHPRRIYEGVRLGVEHGGNKSGIPTVNGSVTFHERFLGKPLVFCGTVGLLPRQIGSAPGHEKWVEVGDRIVMVGGRIGKDGIHGATFSSLELSEASPATAVQIGDPITQKKMFDFLLVARERGFYNAITDNGAGGLSSSVGEMAELSGGAEIHLEKAPLKYPGLQPWEILVSEAQERMTLAVPEENMAALLALSAEMGVESTDLGRFTDSGFFQAFYQGKPVAHLEMEFLHNGLPPMQLKANWVPPLQEKQTLAQVPSHTESLKKLLGRLNICSKESMIRQYDHEVQGASVVKPLVGEAMDGPSDGAVMRPVLGSMRGLAVAHGICPRYSDLDAFAMAANATDEAVRNLIAVGADPGQIAALDNYCWCDPLPSPTNPDAEYKLAQLVQASEALYQVVKAYQIPLISGKDSMKNDYVHEGNRIAIPPTLLVTAVGIVPDVRRALTMDAKAAGDLVYLLGETREELGGSEYYAELGVPGGVVPKVFPERAKAWYQAFYQAGAAEKPLVNAAHDCSDGGLAVALAETAFSGGLGMALSLGELAQQEGLTPEALLFSESASRLVVTVKPENRAAFEEKMKGQPLHLLGQVTDEPVFIIRGQGGEIWVEADWSELKAFWQKPLKEF